MQKIVKSVLTFMGIALASAEPGFAEGLTGYWDFEGGVADKSGHGYDGRLLGSGNYVAGRYGLSLRPLAADSGSANPAIVDQLGDFSAAEAFTVSLWVRPETGGGEGVLVSKSGEDHTGFVFEFVQGRLRASIVIY